ncbi:MAG TPA: ATP-grasp domain-containing protein [Candidatus Limnocylindrales bacterium]|nr:ATP-grasp domain-containing protein [Candidatus Limnocylindrales bacterium]
MKIFVHEFITGGGLIGEELPASLMREGAWMLEAILQDFLLLPQHQIFTSYDERLRLTLPVHQKVPVKRDGYLETFLSLVQATDATLLIAPETDGILAKLTRWVEKEGKLLLGSTAEGIEWTGDKLSTYKRFEALGIPFPKTQEANFGENLLEKVKVLDLPLILKPVDGAGCSGVFLLRRIEDIPSILAQLAQETRHNRFLIQEYIAGIHASVSVISNGIHAVPLTLNAQFIEESQRLIYKGGLVPLPHPLKQEVFRLVRSLPTWIKGLQGYLGVDLILTEDRPVFIEINPRLTTSYVGIRQVLPFNLAEAILRAVMKRELPEEVEVRGQVKFAS